MKLYKYIIISMIVLSCKLCSMEDFSHVEYGKQVMQHMSKSNEEQGISYAELGRRCLNQTSGGDLNINAGIRQESKLIKDKVAANYSWKEQGFYATLLVSTIVATGFLLNKIFSVSRK